MTVQAKPIVRQAGFRPSFSHSIAEQGPESTANSQAAEATQRSKSLGLPKSSVCKEVRTLSGMLSGQSTFLFKKCPLTQEFRASL